MIQGSLVAIVTPMHPDGRVDEKAFRRLIDWHVEQGTDAIVAVGTTGESATLDEKEHCDAIALVVDHAAGRIPVIAGTGDTLTLTSSLEGTGISLIEDGASGRLVLEGTGSIEDYQNALRSLQFGFAEGDGERGISVQVTDEAGNVSNTEIATISPWFSVEDWQAWFETEDRKKIQASIDAIPGVTTEYTIYRYIKTI